MFRRNRSQKMRIFRGIFLSYILILILPFAFGSFVYVKALDIIEKDAKDARIFMLKQSRGIIENYFKDLDQSVVSMSLNLSLRNLMYMDKPGYGSPDIYYVTLTQKEIKSFKTSSTFENNLYIFLKKSDLVLTRSDINFGIQDYYMNILKNPDMDYDNWYNKTLNSFHVREINPVATIINSDNPKQRTQYLTYIQSLPFGVGNNILGAIVVSIKADDINKLLMDVDESKTGDTFILDKDGKLVVGTANSNKNDFPDILTNSNKSNGSFYKKINGVDSTIIYIKSSYNHWTYVTVLPTKAFMDKAIYIKKVILAIVCLSLFLGLVISVYLTKRNILPIRETMLTLRKVFKGELGNGRNEYDFLKNGITKLINSHEEMKRSMENQGMLMKSTFLSRLIRGEISDEGEIEILSEHLGIQLKGKMYVAVIIVLNRFFDLVKRETLIEQDINRVIIEDVINKHIGDSCYTYILDADQITLLLNFNTNADKECEEITETILLNVKNELQITFNINVSFAVGNLYEKIADINLSFSEAKNTLNYFNEINNDNGIIWYKNVKKESSGYYYPVELEQQLINMAKSGSRNDIDRVMDIIYNENFVQRSLTNYMEYNLFFEMKGTIIKVIGEVNSSLDIKEVISGKYSSMSVKDIFEIMKNEYYKICNETSNKKKSHNNLLLSKLVDHIQSNYFSSEVSASNIAAQFNISESYFSQFFKEQVGETFSDYLEKIRIERACELLSKKNMSVEDTSKFVGYNSAYTFRRAFKRVTGVLPTAYKG